MSALRRIVLDVLKPHDPSLREFADQMAEVDSVQAVVTSLIELDNEVQNVKLTLEGEELDYDAIETAIDNLGGSIHSVDQTACGEYVLEEHRTLQDG